MSNNPLLFREQHHLLRLKVVDTTGADVPLWCSCLFFTPTPERVIRNLHVLAKSFA